jgi:hypothetical protein
MSSKGGVLDISGAQADVLKSCPTHAAATSTESVPLFVAPCACKVTWVGMTTGAAVTGDNTNRTNINLLYKGADGSTGAVEIGNLDLTTGVDLVAWDEKTITLNATYTAGKSMAEGDVLAVEFEKAGNGLLITNPLFRIEWNAVS